MFEREPVNRQRRWVVVLRRPGAAAYVDGPFTLEKAEALASTPKWPDAVTGVYELRKVAAFGALVERARELSQSIRFGGAHLDAHERLAQVERERDGFRREAEAQQERFFEALDRAEELRAACERELALVERWAGEQNAGNAFADQVRQWAMSKRQALSEDAP